LAAPNADPSLLADVQLLTTGMYEIELAPRELLVESAIALEGHNTVDAALDDCQALQTALAIRLGFGFKSLNDEPLVWIGLAYF
jgi:hypothetical protein